MSREWWSYHCHCSNIQPIIDLTHCFETKQLRPLNNRQCWFDNGFDIVQNSRPCSLSRGTSNGTTPSLHQTFSLSGLSLNLLAASIFPLWSLEEKEDTDLVVVFNLLTTSNMIQDVLLVIRMRLGLWRSLAWPIRPAYLCWSSIQRLHP